MLLQLSIQNIALIAHVSVSFAPGFTVLTGETGAGKSIIVGSLDFVLGGRADKDRIAFDANRGQVEALFDVSQNPKVLALLASMQIEIDDGLLPISREINRNGRSLCRIAGVTVPIAKLKEITAHLVDLHGQHAHQSLLDAAKHLAFLDGMGDASHQALAAETTASVSAWQAVRKELTQKQGNEQEKARREDMLRFQLEELDNAVLVPGEEEQLDGQRMLMRNAERIQEALQRAYAYTFEGIDDGIPSAIDAMRVAMASLGGISRYGETYERLAQQLSDAVYALESICGDLSSLQEEAQSDPQALEQIESRLDLLHKLHRKYGATTADMIAYREQIRQELETSENAEAVLALLQKKEKQLHMQAEESAEALSASRHRLAAVCEKRVKQELAELGMEKACFTVSFQEQASLTPQGKDKIEFLLSANTGEPLKPLSRVASGGELSRIMLAFKCIEAENEGVPVLVFDEVDTGISGQTGQVVAEKMQKVSTGRQVLCVTHLPQIAAIASAQYVVEKQEQEGKTRTALTLLDMQGRTEVIARMLGGGETAHAHAGAMLRRKNGA